MLNYPDEFQSRCSQNFTASRMVRAQIYEVCTNPIACHCMTTMLSDYLSDYYNSREHSWCLDKIITDSNSAKSMHTDLKATHLLTHSSLLHDKAPWSLCISQLSTSGNKH